MARLDENQRGDQERQPRNQEHRPDRQHLRDGVLDRGDGKTHDKGQRLFLSLIHDG